jgi:protein TonB
MNAIRTSARFLMTGSFGLAMPALVFFALHALTERASDGKVEVVEGRKVDFTRLVVETERIDKLRVKPTPPRKTKKPAPGGTGRLRVCADCSDPGQMLGPVRPVVLTGPRTVGPSFSSSGMNGDPQPFVRVLPDYPPNGRGDGWVLVQFDVSAAGAVVDPRVVDASPRGMFDKNALRAIERWRYRPAVVDGQAVERRGLRVKLRFVLEKA